MKLESEYTKLIRQFQIKFGVALRHKDPAISELICILTFSLLLNMDTINAVSIKLGIPKCQLYGSVGKLSLSDWRKLFKEQFLMLSVVRLVSVQQMSAATNSRAKIQLSLDDSVIRKTGKKLSYMGKWWSGQFQRVVSGYDVLLVVLKIDGEVYPVSFWLMSKKDPIKTRIARSVKLLTKLGETFQANGVDLSKIAVTCDAAYACEEFVVGLQAAGFKKLGLGAKSDWVLYDCEDGEVLGNLAVLLSRAVIEAAAATQWGIGEQVASVKGFHSTLGAVKVIARICQNQVRYFIGIGMSRTVEIYRVWKAHYRIEQVFKELKQYVAWGKYQLQGPGGAYATVVLPFLAYGFLKTLKRRLGKHLAIGRLKRSIEMLLERKGIKELTDLWALKHFEVKLPDIDKFLGIAA